MGGSNAADGKKQKQYCRILEFLRKAVYFFAISWTNNDIETTTSTTPLTTYFFSTTMTEFRITGIYVLVSTTLNPHLSNNAAH